MEEGDKSCPHCAEPVRSEAIYCKHCSRKIRQSTPAWRWFGLGIFGAAALGWFFFNRAHILEANRQNDKFVEEMATRRIPGIPENKQGVAVSQLEPSAVPTMSPKDIFNAYSSSVVLLQNYDEDDELVATGSGFCVGNFLIATNYHVLRGASRLVAKTQDSATFEGSEIEAYDPQTDLAVIKFENLNLKEVPIGDPSALKQGDHVTAIGAPLGIQNTLSDGLVTNLLANGGVIQTSAPISHGSSGGPLLDDHGRVIGIISATRPEGELVNFAISVAYLQRLLGSHMPVQFSQFLAQTKVETPILQGGVSVSHGQVVSLPFTVPANHVAVIQGSFSIYGGTGNDISWGLVQGLPNRQIIQVVPLVRNSGNAEIHQKLQTGNYALILDNRFSVF